MLEDLILYFVFKTKGFITKTQLVKFLYLADLYSVKWTGQQLTQLNWCYYNYGPWDEEINSALDRLEGKILPRQEGKATIIGMADELAKTGIDDLNLSEGLQLVLENIRKEWAGTTSNNINALLEHVYSTAPMIEAKNKYQPQDNAQLNLQLEREKLIEQLGV
jgi:Protein of unknown function (DUF4065)